MPKLHVAFLQAKNIQATAAKKQNMNFCFCLFRECTEVRKLYTLFLSFVSSLFAKCNRILKIHQAKIPCKAEVSGSVIFMTLPNILPVASIGLGWKIYQKSAIQATFKPILHITRIRQKTAVKLYAIINEF